MPKYGNSGPGPPKIGKFGNGHFGQKDLEITLPTSPEPASGGTFKPRCGFFSIILSSGHIVRQGWSLKGS